MARVLAEAGSRLQGRSYDPSASHDDTVMSHTALPLGRLLKPPPTPSRLRLSHERSSLPTGTLPCSAAERALLGAQLRTSSTAVPSTALVTLELTSVDNLTAFSTLDVLLGALPMALQYAAGATVYAGDVGADGGDTLRWRGPVTA